MLLATCLAVAAILLSAPALGAPVAYTIVNGTEVPASLTGAPGDVDVGRQIYFDIEVTGCSGCHGSPGGPGAQPTPGTVAPTLSGVASRLSEGAIRLWIVAPQAIRPGTLMPSYYAAGQRKDPNDPRFGEPRLSAFEIEALVAYLMRQRDP